LATSKSITILHPNQFNNMSEILVITCPGGKINQHLLPILYKQEKYKLRLAAHSQTSTEKLKAKYPNAEIRKTDISSFNECLDLLKDATVVLHIGPSFHSREKEMGFNMVDAAIVESQKPGSAFKHFVFCGVLNTQHRNLVQHDLKSYIEERLMLSTLSWTILQPTNFINVYPIAKLASEDKPVISKLWKPDVANSVIVLQDLAEAAAKVVNEREVHYLAQYPLCSTMPLSDAEIIAKIGKYLGKDIEHTTPDFETGVDSVLKFLFGGARESNGAGSTELAAAGDTRPDITRDEAERLILFSNRRGLKGSPNVLRWLLEREPTTVEGYVQLELKSAGLA
jgi:uncharacterized protein YbjT (DUF2867 family)